MLQTCNGASCFPENMRHKTPGPARCPRFLLTSLVAPVTNTQRGFFMRYPFPALACALVGAALPLHAQEFRASLTGHVLDAAGAPIASAKIRLTNTSTGEMRDVASDSQGSYLVPLLNPAVYTVRAEA